MTDGPLMVLDSAGLWFRAFHSVPEKITGPDGAPANAVRGFCDMVAVLLEEHSPTALVAALDSAWRPDWRVALLPGYKAHRVGADGTEDAPPALGPQVDTIRELLRAAGATLAGAADSEADDVIAHYAATGRTTLVVTGDRDLLQLASPTTTVVYVGAGMRKRRAYTPADVAEQFGLPAKTAADLLTRHGDLDGVLAAAADPDSGLTPRRRAALTEAADYVAAARGVVRLGGRALRPEVDGDPDGRRGPVDAGTLDRIAARTGQGRAIERLCRALDVLAPA